MDISADDIRIIFILKLAKIDINIWPAVRLAANLIPKATGLDILLIISINIKSGARPRGAPLGISKARKLDLKLETASSIMLVHIITAKLNVMLIKVDIGKTCKINPRVLINKMNTNKDRIGQ